VKSVIVQAVCVNDEFVGSLCACCVLYYRMEIFDKVLSGKAKRWLQFLYVVNFKHSIKMLSLLL
jgi:hypothetical protein